MINKEVSLAFRIKSLNNQIRRMLERTAIFENTANLTGTQYAILGFIDDKGADADVYQRDIEAEFNIRRSTASEMVQQLEKEGFIYRQSVAGDARLKKIIMTEKAKELGKIAKRNMEHVQAKLIKGIPEEEMKQFYKTLDKIQNNIER